MKIKAKVIKRRKLNMDVIGMLVFILIMLIVIVACAIRTDNIVRHDMNSPDFEKNLCEHMQGKHVYHNGTCEYIGE